MDFARAVMEDIYYPQGELTLASKYRISVGQNLETDDINIVISDMRGEKEVVVSKYTHFFNNVFEEPYEEPQPVIEQNLDSIIESFE